MEVGSPKCCDTQCIQSPKRGGCEDELGAYGVPQAILAYSFTLTNTGPFEASRWRSTNSVNIATESVSSNEKSPNVAPYSSNISTGGAFASKSPVGRAQETRFHSTTVAKVRNLEGRGIAMGSCGRRCLLLQYKFHFR